MKRQGKLLTLVLAVLLSALMLVSASGLEIFIIASSDEYESFATSATYLEAIGVLKGYDDGELHLQDPILRYQAALFFGRIVTGVVDEAVWGEDASTKFTDVPQYGGVIDMVSGLGIIRGYGDGTFGYNDGIRYQDMCAMMLRALGYETEAMIKAYPMSYVLKAEELGMDLQNVLPTDYLNRGQVAQMAYDALTTPISPTNDENLDKIIQYVLAAQGTQNVNVAKDTYLERNFDVSPQMYFQIVATENYKMSGSYAEKGYFNAVQLRVNEAGTALEQVGTTWSFPIDGEAVNDVSEGDLIGKYLTLIFDHKAPTQELLEDEECTIVHADIATADVFQNFGELGFVKFNTAGDTLTLGPKTVAFDGELDPVIYAYTDDAATVFDTLTAAELRQSMEGDANADVEAHTYFHIEAYDFNNDGEYDALVYVPYTFGQYVARTYKGNTYHMVGQYSSTPKYDMTNTAEKTEENKTHFIEKFLGTNVTAGNTSNYTPGNTNMSVSASAAEYSLNATLTGDEIQSGNFMLYNYNKITGELYVAEDLGTFQLGTMTGFRTGAETYIIDGASIGVGMPGAVSGNVGLLTQATGFAATMEDAKTIVMNFEKGNDNIKYLEYDGKLVYFEAYGESNVVVGNDYVIVDIDETFAAHEENVGASEAWDIPYEKDCALVKTVDPATGEFVEIKVEKLYYGVSKNGTVTDEFYPLDRVDERYALGAWVKYQGRGYFQAQGTIYIAKDEDEDGLYELYGRSCAAFKLVGAGVIEAGNDGNGNALPEISFSYNKSNVFVQENAAGILVDRITTNKNTVSMIIGQDGYILLKGELGTDSGTHANKLWLSSAALVLEATDNQLTVFDPLGFVAANNADNVYKDSEFSVWNVGDTDKETGIQYYMMLQNSMYTGSEAMLDENGDFVKNENGQKLYKHNYRNLYNLVTGATQTVSLITTDIVPEVSEVVNSIEGVIRYDADKYEDSMTTFGDVFVENGDYQYGAFAWLAAKDKISFATQAKDKNGNNRLEEDEQAKSVYYNADSDVSYRTLSSLNVTFIDLDAGADVDPNEYSFQDAYVFYQATDSNKMTYAGVELIDREEGVDYAEGTYPIKRHYISKTDVTNVIANGAITKLTAGKNGLISSAGFYRWNGWSDYLIPAVDEDGETIWSYAGSLRVEVRYYAYIDYDEDAKAVDAVVVRVGKVVGKVATTDADYNKQIVVGKEPTDPEDNMINE